MRVFPKMSKGSRRRLSVGLDCGSCPHRQTKQPARNGGKADYSAAAASAGYLTAPFAFIAAISLLE